MFYIRAEDRMGDVFSVVKILQKLHIIQPLDLLVRILKNKITQMTESLPIWYHSKYTAPIFWWKTSPGQRHQLWCRNRTGISFTWSNQLLHACAKQCPEIKLNNAIIKWKVSRANMLDFSYSHPFIPYEATTLKQSACRQCFQEEFFFSEGSLQPIPRWKQTETEKKTFANGADTREVGT